MTQGSGQPILIDGERIRALEPLALTSGPNESWLQQLLDKHPAILPVEEISAAWGPLISLGREIELPVGYIDNMFVSPTGEVTVVEAKLWRNPEARRKVVGQLLDYAAALARLTYEDLEATVRASTGDDRSIWERVAASATDASPVKEARFIDTVLRNLRTGRFLLLIVGDGIRSDLHGLAELLGRHPTLGFHLELIELRLFNTAEGSMLVLPARIGRTVEVVRSIVEIRGLEAADVTVAIDVPTEQRRAAGARYQSVEEFVTDLTDAVGEQRAQRTAELIAWWQDERRGVVKLNKRSLNLGAPYRHTSGGSVSVMTVYNDGRAEGSVAPMSLWRGIISQDDAQARYEAAGFSGDPQFPAMDLDCVPAEEAARVRNLMVWADELIRSASEGPAPVIDDGGAETEVP